MLGFLSVVFFLIAFATIFFQPIVGIVFILLAIFAGVGAGQKKREKQLDTISKSTLATAMTLESKASADLMMCKTCGKGASINAAACPHCGEPDFN